MILSILIQDQNTSHFMGSNGETIKMKHIYFWELILWGMSPEQTSAHANCTLCPNIDLNAIKDMRQSPTPSHFHTLLSCSIIHNIFLHSLHPSHRGQGKVTPKLDEKTMSTVTHFP
jgi:hypothetical protein